MAFVIAAIFYFASRRLSFMTNRAALGADPPLIVFVADGDSALAGFIELGLRSVAEGCSSSPVPYVEGWYVEAAARRRGIGGALMHAAESWCREQGYREFGSDAL